MLGFDEIESINLFFDLRPNLPVKSIHRQVLQLLCGYRDHKTGKCNPSRDTLASAAGVSVTTIKNANRDLKSWGALAWKSGGEKVSNSYQLLVLDEPITEEMQAVEDYFKAMNDCYKTKLTEAEKLALETWEKEQDWEAASPEQLGTSEWPGWEKYIGKHPQQGLSSPGDSGQTAAHYAQPTHSGQNEAAHSGQIPEIHSGQKLLVHSGQTVCPRSLVEAETIEAYVEAEPSRFAENAQHGNDNFSFDEDDPWYSVEATAEPKPASFTICPDCKGQGYVYIDEDKPGRGVRECQCRKRSA
jgi:hypothetical protein